MTRYIVFTDLDGTLLDHETYDYTKALTGVSLLKQAGIPIVFCSSKTRREQEVLRSALGIRDPFIVEDGGAVYIDKGYFEHPVDSSYEKDGCLVLALGSAYEQILDALKSAAGGLGLSIKGYADATAAEVSEATGLSIEAAARAKAREFEETVLSPLTPSEASMLEAALHPLGFTLSRGGRFYSVKGQNNKGKAAMRLTELYAQKNRNVTTVGIGDSGNDLPLLSVVDIPILVQRPDKRWQPLSMPGVKRVEGVGPEGWTRAVEMLLSSSLG